MFWYRHDIGDYMQRWILPLGCFGALRLHHILRSDLTRDLHDHPFDFWSFLLTGGYLEVLPGQTEKWWPRFSIVRHRAEDLHALIVAKPVWTIVWAGPRRRPWGFATEHGWVHHTEYYAAGGTPA